MSANEYLRKRGESDPIWYYYRRVPSRFAHLDKHPHVMRSTKIRVADDRTGAKAGRVAVRMNAATEALWSSLAETKATEARQTYDDAIKLSRFLGLDYLQPSVGAQKPIREVLERIETAIANGRLDNPSLRKAALGGVAKAEIRLSSLYSEYEITQRTKLSKMSPNQQRKWTSAKKRAVEILIEQRGDKALRELGRDDALSYADWWEDRVVDEGIKVGTANKSISHVNGMMRAVDKRYKLGLDNVFSGTRIESGKDGSRKPFELDFIKNTILADGKLAKLNDDARDVVYVLLETGARPSEIVNLSKQRIILDAAIPYIRIQAEDRLLKTEHSEREVPLVGMALDAMQRHPNGFVRYYDKADNFSATAMKYFKKHKLLPSNKHSIYSFRHSFKDRLKAVEAPEELIDELMAHVMSKPKYGDGYGLRLKQKFLQAICLTSPVLAAVA